jgi:protein-disulfide isomerase
VTLFEFADLRCRYCREFGEKVLPLLVDRYLRTGRLRVVFENLPILGPGSAEAARMAVAVGLQGRLFDFIEAFYRNADGQVGDDVFRRIAAEIPGVNVEQAITMRDSAAVTSALDDVRTLAERFSVDRTPSFLLGRTGETPFELPGARASEPDTITGPIDQLLAHP